MYLELIAPYIGTSSELVPQKVEAGAIRRFAIASLETNPIYYDEEYAKTTPYGTIIAPPNFARTFFIPPVCPVEGEILPIQGRIHGAQKFEYLKPMKAGDTVYFRSTLLSARETQGSQGYSLFVTFEHAVLDEQGDAYSLGYSTCVYRESLLKSTDPNRFNSWYPHIPDDRWLSGLDVCDPSTVAVGDTIGPIQFPEITRTWIAQWAGASGDFNPIHLDDSAAKASGMDGCITHGMLSATVVSRVFSYWLSEHGQLVRSCTKFTAPVKPGDRLTMTATVLSVTPEEERMIIEWEYILRNASQATVLSGSLTGILPHTNQSDLQVSP